MEEFPSNWSTSPISKHSTIMLLTINGKPRSFEVAMLSVAELVSTLELQGKRLAIECNGEIVPRSQFADTQLADGDKLEIVGAVGGG